MSLDESEVADHFVVAYYSSLIYHPRDLPKFYQENASIFRPQFPSPRRFPSDHPELCPSIPPGSQFSILNHIVLPFSGGISIQISGQIADGNEIQSFTQFFTLLYVFERYFIVSDSFTIPSKIPTVETVVVPKPQAEPERQQNRYKPTGEQRTGFHERRQQPPMENPGRKDRFVYTPPK
jgi:hypothetical protein